MGSTRVLSVGWDGADLATIDSLIARGELPNLARLRRSGVDGPLESLPGLADDPHWSSIATALPPDAHGRFHHSHPEPGTYRQRHFPRDQMSTVPFWEQLAAAGRRVAVLDAPKAPLGAHLNLRVVADWMPHGEDGPTPVGLPAEVVDEMSTRYGSTPALDCHRVIEPGDEHDIAVAIRDRLELRTRVALDWLAEEDWDLFLVVFAESHCIGHHCWHVHDASHPEHDAAARDRLGDVVEEMYIRQDEALGRLIAAAGPDVAVMVFSPLGMGPNFSGDRLVQTVLDRLTATEGADTPLRTRVVERVPRWIRREVRQRVPWLRRPARPRGPWYLHRDAPYWQLQHDAISSAIRFNVVGRDPTGVINPGADFEHHRDLITKQFQSLRRLPEDTPVVSEVVDVAEAFPAPMGDRFADLLIVWDTAAPIDEVASPSLGRIIGPSAPMRSGNHRAPGWSVVAAPGRGSSPLPTASVVEIGPTIAHLLGVSLSGVPDRSLTGATPRS